METLCRLDTFAGAARPCPEIHCPFWEPGGAVLDGRCAFELLDLDGRSSLVEELRRLRDELERAEAEKDERAAWHAFHRLLNEASEG